MFRHVKQLQYTVRVAEPNPGLANLLLEQFGGPQGELAAACRYFTQGLSDDDPGRKDMLMDIATEELSHPKLSAPWWVCLIRVRKVNWRKALKMKRSCTGP